MSRLSDNNSKEIWEIMDLDLLDVDLMTSWPFDPIAAFVGASSTNSFPNPPSPLWPTTTTCNNFEESTTTTSPPPEAAAAAANMDLWNNSLADCPRIFSCNYGTTNGNNNEDDGKTRQLRMSTENESSDDYCLIRERMTQALRYFKESTEQHALVQVWAPVKNGDRYVLTTSGQPFVLDPQSLGLHQYRTVSMMYMFSANEDSDGDVGLPGRVFRQKMPEWTPNVQYYSSKEYPRLSHAVQYNVRGTLALPVFEPSMQSCVGVVELIMTSQKTNYASEVNKVCKALEAVNLKGYEILDHPSIQICNEGRQTALAEILEILTTVCEAYKLPLAQTWVPCRHRSVLAHGGGSKKSCSSFDGNCLGQVCMSTSDVAVYVIDAHKWEFRDACVEHHLQKGQGVAGIAFASRRSCFSRDVTQFRKTEYPLVHYARMFGLSGCLAVCLQSSHTGTDDYILEFFLPPDHSDTGEQQALLNSMSTLMNQSFRSLKVIGDADLQGKALEIIDVPANTNDESELKRICGQSGIAHMHTKSNEVDPIKHTNYSKDEENLVSNLSMDANTEKDCTELIVNLNGSKTLSPLVVSTSEKQTERKRGKAEKSISLEVLRQYFSGSLKDAARSLGVCPTTMKRICRQHGISRWPSRKINKVNRSLTKLQRVIESVQGAEGAFNLPSLTCQLPMAVNLDAYKQTVDAKPPNFQNNKVDKDLSPQKTPGSDNHCSKLKSQQDLSSLAKHGSDCHYSRARSSSREGSIDIPASQESCEEVNPLPSDLAEEINISDSLRLNRSMPDVIEEPQTLLGRILIEDSGSSKDLKILFSSAVEDCADEHAMVPTNNNSSPALMQDLKTATIKANYRDDIIRFRLPCGAGVDELNEEVAKRLKLEVGTFDIKYLDDDQEWVMLSCDADLEECIEIARLSSVHVIRLSVHDINSFLGSSCGSSDG